jgi:hypothetical protein
MPTIVEQVMRLQADNNNLRQQLRGSGGQPPGGPRDPDLEALNRRVHAIEGRLDSSDVLLRSIDKGIAIIDTKLEAIDKRLDALGKQGDGLGSRLDDMTRRIDTTVAAAISRVPSWWQMPAVLGGMLTLIGGAYAAAKHFGLLP